MSKCTFIFEQINHYTDEVDSKHVTEFRADDLTSMLENFELFLRGCGWNFDGVIDVVKTDDVDFDDEEEDRGSAVMSSMVDDMIKNPFTMKMPGTLGSADLKFDNDFSSIHFNEIKPLTTDQLQDLNIWSSNPKPRVEGSDR